MNHTVNAVLRENLLQQGAVANIAFVECGCFACDIRHALNDFGRCVGQIVQNNRVMPSVQQFHHCVRADKTCATCNQDIHADVLFV